MVFVSNACFPDDERANKRHRHKTGAAALDDARIGGGRGPCLGQGYACCMRCNQGPNVSLQRPSTRRSIETTPSKSDAVASSFCCPLLLSYCLCLPRHTNPSVSSRARRPHIQKTAPSFPSYTCVDSDMDGSGRRGLVPYRPIAFGADASHPPTVIIVSHSLSVFQIPSPERRWDEACV